MKYTRLKEEIDSFLTENKCLIHASIIQDINILKPSICGNLFVTNDIGYAIHHVLKKQIGKNSIHIMSYSFFNKEFMFCSIAKEFDSQIKETNFSLFFCDEKHFTFHNKLGSRLSSLTFNILEHPGSEWVYKNELKPSYQLDLSIDDIMEYNYHSINDSRIKVLIICLLKALLTKITFKQISNSRIITNKIKAH